MSAGGHEMSMEPVSDGGLPRVRPIASPIALAAAGDSTCFSEAWRRVLDSDRAFATNQKPIIPAPNARSRAIPAVSGVADGLDRDDRYVAIAVARSEEARMAEAIAREVRAFRAERVCWPRRVDARAAVRAGDPI